MPHEFKITLTDKKKSDNQKERSSNLVNMQTRYESGNYLIKGVVSSEWVPEDMNGGITTEAIIVLSGQHIQYSVSE